MGEGFFDPVESRFYGRCVASYMRHLAGHGTRCDEILELGAGSGRAVCDAVVSAGFPGVLRGYEIDRGSYRTAARTVRRAGLSARYRIEHADFFEATAARSSIDAVIANPPYLPSDHGSPAFPELSGGRDGNEVMTRLLEHGATSVMIMMSSYSDPMATMRVAADAGYRLVDWKVRRLRMGSYSCRNEVRKRILDLVAEKRAFVNGDTYLLAGVTWCHDDPSRTDLSPGLAATFRRFGRGRTDSRVMPRLDPIARQDESVPFA